MRPQRIGLDVGGPGQADPDPQAPVGLAALMLPKHRAAEFRRGHAQAFEEHAGRKQAGLAAAVVVEIALGCQADAQDEGIGARRDRPGLHIVAARRPAGGVEDAADLVRGPRLRRWRGLSGHPREQALGDRQLDAVQRVVGAEAKSASDPAAAIGIELMVERGRVDGAAAGQQLDDLGPGDAGAELGRHAGRRSAPAGEIDMGGIGEIAKMQALGRESQEEAHVLPLLGQPLEAEILFEGHAAGLEDQERGAHAERRSGHGRDAELGAAGKNLAADVEGEEIETIDIDVGVGEEGVDGFFRDARRKKPEVELGIDRPGEFGHDRAFRPPDRRHGSADLAVEVDHIVTVGVRQGEGADTEPGKRQEVDAADPAKPGDRRPPGPQRALLPIREPAEIA